MGRSGAPAVACRQATALLRLQPLNVALVAGGSAGAQAAGRAIAARRACSGGDF